MTRGRTLARTTATATAAGFLLLSAGPAMAADPTAQAEGEAIRLSVAGNSVSDQVGGPYRVVRNGERETATGSNQPRAELLTGQTAAQIGTLAQDATTSLENRRGASAACAGIAGDGASLASVGDAGEFCLTPGDTASLTAGQLDLNILLETSLVEGTPDLDEIIRDIPGLTGLPTLPDLLDQLNSAIGGQIDQLGDPGLVLDLGAIQSRCTAGPGETAEGSAELVDVGAFLRFPTGSPVEEFQILSVDERPAPNTPLEVELGDLATQLASGIADSLTDAGVPPQLRDGLDEIIALVEQQLLNQLTSGLEPLRDVIAGTVNKQETGPGEIEVTALDLQVLPIIADQAGFSAIDAQLGRSQCGPSGAVAPGPGPSGEPEPLDPPRGGANPGPEVPRSVPAGLADQPSDVPPMLALGALVTLATATGIAVHRRASRA